MAQQFAHIPSKTACRGFDSFCPYHEKSPKLRGFGAFLYFLGRMFFEDRGRGLGDAPNVSSGAIRFLSFRLVQYHFSIKKHLPRPAKRWPGEIILCVIHSSTPAVMSPTTLSSSSG